MTFGNPVDPEASFWGKGDYFKMPGVYQNKMPVWEQASTAASRGSFLFYSQNKYWMVGPDHHKDEGHVASKEPGLTQLPLTGWQIAKKGGGGWRDAPDLRLITRDQAEGRPVKENGTRRRDQGNRTVSCGGKEVSSCFACSTCDTDCFTWPQKLSLQKPCVSKQCKCYPVVSSKS